MDGGEQAIRPLRPWLAAICSKALAEWPVLIVLAVGAFLRSLAMLGFRPALWVNDSFEYIGVAQRWQAYPGRPDGYPALLRVLLTFHSIALVAAIQHLMALGIGVMIYALLRHWRVRRWLAAAACLVYLLDVHEIQLEHLILSDTLFLLFLVAGVTLLAWCSRVSPWFAGGAGLLLALSALTRTVGTPLLILAGAYLLLRRAGWRSLLALVALATVPLAAYSAWFDHEHGSFAVTSSDGIFLYSRVMAFADCSVIKPPKSVAMLCDPRPPSERGLPSNFIWHAGPLDNLPGPRNGETARPAQRFSVLRNSKARQFAIDAILAQPGALLRTTWDGFVMSFDWSRPPYPSRLYVQEDSFTSHPTPVPFAGTVVTGATVRQDLAMYNRADPSTRVVAPFAGILMGYQRVGWVPGPMLALLLGIGFIGCVAFWRRDERRWQVLLLWAVAMSLLVLPVLTAQFDNRYVLPAPPFAAAAAALALAVLVPDCSTAEGKADEPDLLIVDGPMARPRDDAVLG